MNTQTCNCAQRRPALQKEIWTLATCLLAAVLLAGCASTKVTSSDRLVYGMLPRPNQILVYDFASTPADVPSDSTLATQSYVPSTSATEEQLALGRQLGTSIAAQLIDAIREMGLPAGRGVPGMTPQINDIVIRGYLVSVDKGSAAGRMVIGFGAGGSELSTFVEGYQMTAQGLRKLGSGTIDSKGNKTPGAGVGAATWLITGSPIGLIVSGGMKIYGEASGSSKIEGRAKKTAQEIAAVLKTRFQEQGWIQ